jgi:DNA repair protein RadC
LAAAPLRTIRPAAVPLDVSAARTAVRDRVLRLGVESLSDGELLALLTRLPGGAHAADSLLAAAGGLRTLVTNCPYNLGRLPGFGLGRASILMAALELGRRVLQSGTARPCISTAQRAYEHLAPSLQSLRRENFRVLYLNSRHALLLDACIAKGSVASCPVDPREVFSLALSTGASAMILAHNHPAGDPSPSADDISLTKQLVEAGRLLAIRVLDHIVIGDGRYVSFQERGLMPAASSHSASRPG